MESYIPLGYQLFTEPNSNIFKFPEEIYFPYCLWPNTAGGGWAAGGSLNLNVVTRK